MERSTDAALDELDDANEIAEDAQQLLEVVTLPGVPVDVARALGEPLDPDTVTLPERLPHDRDLFAKWVGRAQFDAQLEDAGNVLGYMAVWHVLAWLERPDEITPTASLRTSIEQRQVAWAVIEELWEATGEPALLKQTRNGDVPLTMDELARLSGEADAELAAAATGERQRMIVHDALGIVGRVVLDDLGKRRAIYEARRNANDAIRAAAAKTNGGRGAYSGAERMRRFVRGVQPLVNAKWSRTQLATLVLDSATWLKPPCRAYVAELLDEVGDDRDRATRVLAGRIRDAERRAS